jgi:hypothetical protein
MFRLFNRSQSVSSPTSPAPTRALVEGLEGRSMMSVSLNPGSEAALLPAVQHGLLLPAVHPGGANAPGGNLSPTTGFIIAI